MRGPKLGNLAFHFVLVAGFVTILAGGVTGLSSLGSSSSPDLAASSRRIFLPRFRSLEPSSAPALRVDPAFGSLIRTSAAFRSGCLAGSSTDSLLKAVAAASSETGLPAELLISMIITESNCRGDRISPRGARGLMQLTPATARSLGVNRPHLAEENVSGGARYISQMLDRFDGDLKLALAAYNAGPANVTRYGAVPPFKETRGYVNKVVRLYSALLLHTTGKGQVARAA